jgi:hypothetical protein
LQHWQRKGTFARVMALWSTMGMVEQGHDTADQIMGTTVWRWRISQASWAQQAVGLT